MTQILDGKVISAQLRVEIGLRAQQLASQGVAACLAVILVGDDPASAVYVRAKTKAARQANVVPKDFRLPATVSQTELMILVAELNVDPSVHGILVQMPLPPHIRSDEVLASLDPLKDVDGLHPLSLGLLAGGRPRFVPCTPRGVMHMLGLTGVAIAGARAVVIGRSVLVGKPMALLLGNANATVVMCHSQTRNLADEVSRADIVVAAVGRPAMIRGEWIADGAVVIDVGINRGSDGKLVGDVEYAQAALRARAITPVPGGVGPMTIACLLENTVDAAAAGLERLDRV
jgi:methylenetetrahydrofolate dehydrogenase (NADP+) / methenyltetrahydrofolate cyclohydrolase